MNRRQSAEGSRQPIVAFCVLLSAACLLASCGYSARPGLASHLRTVYVKPFANRIDLTQLTNDYEHFPLYRHGMEVDLTKAVEDRFQFTGLLRLARPDKADSRLEAELMEFRRDALRYDANQNVEEWRLSVVLNVKFYDLRLGEAAWAEDHLTGDTTYFATGANTESEATALDRAIKDTARRIVERTVENW